MRFESLALRLARHSRVDRLKIQHPFLFEVKDLTSLF